MRGPPGPRGSSQEADKSERRAADSQVPVPGALLPRGENSAAASEAGLSQYAQASF